MIQPKISSYTVLHYGRDYLPYALRSVAPVVDRSFVFFTPHASHGHSTDLPPIESRDELMVSIPADEWDKLTWVDTNDFWMEGQQRDFALRVASEGADLCLVLDYDEVWHPDVLRNILNHVWQENKARQWLINFSHLWRSFNYICRDDAWPVRIIDTRHKDGVAYVSRDFGPIYHLGYAITDKVMQYKLSCHGHKDELRPGWIENKWQAWPPVEDCHPTNGRKDNGEGWWDPEPFDRQQLPGVLHSHPYFNLERVD